MNWWTDELMMNCRTDELIYWWTDDELMNRWTVDELVNWWIVEVVNCGTDDELMMGGGATENDSNRQVYRQNITFLFYDQAQGGKDQDIIWPSHWYP